MFSVAIFFNTEYYAHDNWKRVAKWSCLLSITLTGHTLSNDLDPTRRSQLLPTVKIEEKKKKCILVKLKLCTIVKIHGLSCELGAVFEGVFPREMFDAFPGVTECLMFISFSDLRERQQQQQKQVWLPSWLRLFKGDINPSMGDINPSMPTAHVQDALFCQSVSTVRHFGFLLTRTYQKGRPFVQRNCCCRFSSVVVRRRPPFARTGRLFMSVFQCQ